MTRSRPAPSRKDRTHHEIARALAAAAVVIDTHAMPGIGCDLLVLSRGRVYFVEVKDGALSESRRRLTPNESKRRAECESASVPYVIARDVAEALCALGIAYCDDMRALLPSYRQRVPEPEHACGCGTLEGPARFRK